MLTDAEIADQAVTQPITEIAAKAGLLTEEVEPYGWDKAKISLKALDRLAGVPDGKLILATAMTPHQGRRGQDHCMCWAGNGA